MYIMSKAISGLLLLNFISRQLEVMRTDVFPNNFADYFKTKTIFLLTFENLFFYTGFTDCRLLIAFVFYLNILIFLVLHLLSDTFF